MQQNQGVPSAAISGVNAESLQFQSRKNAGKTAQASGVVSICLRPDR